ncbi:ATP-binding protein [Nostoc sp. FACHB-87]|uniref:ATP-binding protein n=1 Tax=Nostocales TaxID=1161 RepID=UPI0016840CD6|nr:MULTISPECIES: ATP-binding protein [Nostocales]MBD2303493.1 ATP-binding protein [Nostoc sp. FACHB-190]MBD2458746.1 ATP-binding protein [Nostoc sp. FACHB-87]MBD2479785.1 ATP-binding protein [Anabaena sp. FACHB-83]MBD2492154.1 ATP-binding protein [Aulosira sp. FACHB-615]
MEVKEAIRFINELVYAKQGRWLEEPEKIVIKAAWLDLEYKEIADNSPYGFEILQRRVAPSLWVLLTGILGNGEKVTKKKLKAIVEQQNHNKLSNTKSDFKFLDILGGNPPEVAKFYGRSPELAMLQELVIREKCVAVIGEAGIGKSALVVKLLQALDIQDCYFNGFIWKSIGYSPSLSSLVTEFLKLISELENQNFDIPKSSEDKITLLIERLRLKPYLIILDSAEALLQGDRNKSPNPYGDEYIEYGTFFRRIVEAQHQSSLVLISRKPFVDITRLQNKGQSAVVLKIEGLRRDAFEILRDKGLKDEHKWGELVQIYHGNPLVLNIVASKIKLFFNNSVEDFLALNTVLLDDIIKENLDDYFKGIGRLTILEKEIVISLVEEMENKQIDLISNTELLSLLKTKGIRVSTSDFIDAINALIERFLVEQILNNQEELMLYIQPVIKKYIYTYCHQKQGKFSII